MGQKISKELKLSSVEDPSTSTVGNGGQEGRSHPQILSDYAQHITTRHPGFSDFPSALSCGLQDLPNELLVKIFGFCDMEDLLRLFQVSKRIGSICQDSSCWKKINIKGCLVKPTYSRKTLPSKVLQSIINYGCEYLTITTINVGDNNVEFNNQSSLKSLFLRDSTIPLCVLKKMLNSCHSLENLSFEFQSFT